MKREFNPQLKMLLEENNIDVNNALCYLLSVFYELDCSCFSDRLKKEVQLLNIFVLKYEKKEVVWEISLFKDFDVNFDWVNEYRDLFKNVNPKRNGSKQVVTSRMRKLFSLYPDIRKDEVLGATKLYLDSVDNYNYITTAERFLFQDRDGSPIIDWIEKFRENNDVNVEQYIDDLI